MITQIILAYPIILLVVASLYITGLLVNHLLKLFESPFGNIWLNLVGHLVLGFVFVATIYAVIIAHGKSILSGIVCLTVLYKILFPSTAANETSIRSKISELINLRAILIVAGIFLIAFLYILAQHYPGLKTGYPVSYVDYFYHAMYARELGQTGIESRYNIFSTYGDFKGIYLYHYLDLWMTDLLARLTGLNHFIAMIFIIYPLLLASMVIGVAGIVNVPLTGNKVWRIGLVVIALAGFSLYFTFFETIPLLNDFWLICFVGKFMSYKLFIVYAVLICAISQLSMGNKQLAAWWSLQLCFTYITTMPGICAGIFVVLLVAWLRGYPKPGLLFKVLALVLFTAAYCLAFDRLFSDLPRDVVDTHFLSGFKEFVVFLFDFVLKLTIVFSPAIAVLVLRIWKRIDFESGEKTGWLFVAGGILCLLPFIWLNRNEPDNEQALFNIIPPVIIILSAIGLYKIVDSDLSLWWRGITVAVIALIAGNNLWIDFDETAWYLKWHNVYSKDYIQTCLHSIDSIEGKTINIVAVNKEDMDRIKRWNYDYHLKDPFLCYSQKMVECIDISPYLQTQRSNTDYFNNRANVNNPIEKWLKKKYPDSLVFNDQILLDFLQTYHVKYMFINAAYKFTPAVSNHLALISNNPETDESFFRTDFN